MRLRHNAQHASCRREHHRQGALRLACAEDVHKKELSGPLPKLEFDTSSLWQSGEDDDRDRHTYPTRLSAWRSFANAVKSGLAEHLPVCMQSTLAPTQVITSSLSRSGAACCDVVQRLRSAAVVTRRAGH